MMEEGVVGCVESSSEGACDVKGVSRLELIGSESSGNAASCGACCSCFKSTSEPGRSSRAGNSTGSLEDCGAGFLRRRLGPLDGNDPSVNEYQGSFTQSAP